MDPLQRFAAYAADFEKTFEDDEWTRLEGYFAEDAIYTVKGTPFDCEVRGRDAIFRAIKKSIDGFDRHFDKRHNPRRRVIAFHVNGYAAEHS